MNAADIIQQIRAHDAELVLDEDRLIVRGKGPRLPEELQAALREHKAEVMIALGAPIDRTVAAILNELRPHLPPSLKQLPDGHLLMLVNWSIIAAFESSVRAVHLDR